MTELETMQRAKMYMDKLAQGIDPISNQEIADDSVLNNVRLARCFFYVSDVLGKVIANGGVVGQNTKTLEFSITPEQLSFVHIFDYPIRITEFTDALLKAANNSEMKKPNVVRITDWLISRGLMIKELGPDVKSRRVPTDRGLQMGMSTRLRQSRDGDYLAVYYDRDMQVFLLNNVMEIFSDGK